MNQVELEKLFEQIYREAVAHAGMFGVFDDKGKLIIEFSKRDTTKVLKTLEYVEKRPGYIIKSLSLS